MTTEEKKTPAKEQIKKEEVGTPKDMMMVSKKDMDRLMEKIDSVSKDNKLLLAIADKKRLHTYLGKHKTKEANIVRLRELNGKIIIGWESTKDIVKNIGNNRWLEDQRIKVLYEDKTTEEMKMTDFELQHTKIRCERVGIVTNEETGKVAFKLKRIDNMKEYIIGVDYVN